MMAGLNKAYEVKEVRRWWKVLGIAFRLTIALGIMGIAALWTMFYGNRVWETIDARSPFFWRIIQWLVTVTLLLFSLTLLYRFGPSLNDRRWQWSIPGAVVAVAIWAVSTLLLRVYQRRFSSERIYGGLNAVVVLLMWLYSTGTAVFIGGEANSEIEKAAAKARHAIVGGSGEKRGSGESGPDN
jgi:membrane protein